MKNVFKKSAIAVLSLASALTCGAATVWTKVSAATANASTVLTASEGLNVEYNVSGSQKVSSFTEDATGIAFSSKENGNAAEGNYVAFNNVLSGLFEMDFRVYTQKVGSIKWLGGNWYEGNDAEQIREVAITLTDVDKNESFTLYIKGGSPWQENVPNARVAYGDVGDNYGSGMRYGASDGVDYDNTTTPHNGGMLENTEYNTQIRGTSFTNSFLHSTAVGFDPITKEVYAYTFKSSGSTADYAAIFNRRVILDLDNTEHLAYAGTGASKLLNCSFNNYKVKFTVTDVTGADEKGSNGVDEPANFIIYSLNGQSLSGENGVIAQEAAPGLSADFSKSATQGEAYAIPTPTLRCIFGQEYSFGNPRGKVKVTAPDGTVVLDSKWAENLSFTPDQLGEYKVTYYNIRNVNSGNKRFAFTVNGYVGTQNEVTYSYPVTVNKALIVSANASDIMQVNGLSVAYDVAGSDLHEDLIRDTSKGISFVSTGVGASAVGSSVSFTNKLTGVMELNFRAYTEVTDSASDWWDGGAWHTRNNAEEIREIAITVTDVDSKESFTVYVQGGTLWAAVTPNARVAYGKAGENYGTGRWYKVNQNGLEYYKGDGEKGLSSVGYNTEIAGTTFSNRARTEDAFIGSGYSTCIGFDPVTKVVYAYTYGSTSKTALAKRPILDLDDPEDMRYLMMSSSGGNVGATLPDKFINSSFQNYTVKMTVTEMTDEKSAKFVIYNLNGQSLAGVDGQLCENAGYGLSLPQGEVGFLGLKTALPTPYASSVLGGEKAFEGTVEVLDTYGNVVVEKQEYSDAVCFTPDALGAYTVCYGGMADRNGFVRSAFTKSANYDGEEERFAYTFEIKETALELPVFDYVMKNMGADVGAKMLGSGLKTYLTIEKDGAIYRGVEELEIQNNYSYAFQDTGVYELTYYVRTAVGGELSYSTSLEVIAMKGLAKDTLATFMLGGDCTVDSDDFTVYYCNEGAISDFDIFVEIFDGSQWISAAAAPAPSVNLNDVLISLGEGEWNARFTVSKDGDSLVFEKTVKTVDAEAPELTVEGLGEDFISTPEDDGETEKNFVVFKGMVGTVPAASAIDVVDGATVVSVMLKTPDSSVATAVDFGQSVTFNLEGEYVIAYRTVDEAGNQSTFVYRILSKTLWLDITAKTEDVELGGFATVYAPEAINGFTNEKVTDFEWTATVNFNGEPLEEIDGAYKPLYEGEYEIVYEVTYLGATQTYKTTFQTRDTQKPTLTVNGTYAKEASLGDKIAVFEATVEDESVYNLVIAVLYNGSSKVEVIDGEFMADKAGRYEIKYSATDVAGNVTTAEFTITVKDPNAQNSFGDLLSGCSSSMGGTLAIGALVTLLGGAMLLRKKEN